MMATLFLFSLETSANNISDSHFNDRGNQKKSSKQKKFKPKKAVKKKVPNKHKDPAYK